jgi:hypothetical protein
MASVLFMTPSWAVQANVDSSLKSFIGNFYRWYAHASSKEDSMASWERAIEAKKASFDENLRKALKEDADAQRANPGEIVGIDFDPFLGCQDPSKGVRCQRIARIKHEVFLVNLVDAGNGKLRVQAKIIRKPGTWVFQNFLYPGNGDLLTLLQRNKDSRRAAGLRG